MPENTPNSTQLKTCSKCKRELPPDRFHRQNTRRDGLQHQCKDCKAKYYADNRDKILAQERKHRAANRDKINARRKQLYADNPEKAKARAMHYAANPKSMREKYFVFCQQCGKSFRPHVSGAALYCTVKCSSLGRRGENHPNWRGGGPVGFYGSSWKTVAESIRERDGYVCQNCGKQQGEIALSVHHKISLRDFGGDYDAANVPENLITLCASCHQRVEAGTLQLHVDAPELTELLSP